MDGAVLPWAGAARAPGLGSRVEVLWDEEDPETGSRTRKWWRASLTARQRSRAGAERPDEDPEEGLPTFDLRYLETESYQPTDEDAQIVLFRGAHVLIDVLSGEEFLFRLPGDRWEPSPADYEAPLPVGEGDFEGGGEDNDQEGDVEGGDEQRDEGTGEPSARSVGARQRAPAEGGSTGEPAPRSDGLSCSPAPPTGAGTCSPPSSLASASPWASASPPPSSLKRPRSPGESHDMALTLGDLDALIRAKEETSGQSVDEACLLALGEVSDTRRLLVATRFREFADVVRRGLEGVVRERGQNVTLTAEDVQNMLGKNK